MSGAGFQVLLSDLGGMASVFRRESAVFEGIMPADGPASPDGGSADVDAAMRAACQLLGLLYQQMAVVIDENARKLQAAHDNYEGTETGLTELARELTLPGPV